MKNKVFDEWTIDTDSHTTKANVRLVVVEEWENGEVLALGLYYQKEDGNWDTLDESQAHFALGAMSQRIAQLLGKPLFPATTT